MIELSMSSSVLACMSRRLVPIALLALTSCLSHAAEQRYAQRVDAIESEYKQAARRLDDADQRAALDLEALEHELIPVTKSSRVQPIEPVAERSQLEDLRILCEAEKPRDDATVSNGRCFLQYHNRLWSELVEHYWAADVAWVVRQLRDSEDPADDESLFVFSHNARLKRYLVVKQQELDQTYRRTKSTIEQVKLALLENARQARDAEIKEAYRRFGEVVSAAARGFVAAGASGRVGQTTPADPFGHCGNDAECGVGFACVKPNFSGEGTCARTVDEHGLPLFTLPRMDSVFTKLPGEDDCRFDGDCPIGFRCSPSSGACFK